MQAAIWRYLVVMYCLSHLSIPPLSFSLYVCLCVRMSVIIIIEKYIWHLMAWTKLSAFKIKSKSARLRRYLHVQEPLEFDATQKPISSLSPTNLLISLPFFLIFLPPLLSLSKQIHSFFSFRRKMGEQQCEVCRKPAKQFCSSCREVFYCSRDCQKQDWKTHKAKCKPFVVKTHPVYGRLVWGCLFGSKVEVEQELALRN